MSLYEIKVISRYGTTSEMLNRHYYEFPAYVPTTAQLQEAVDEIDGHYKTFFQSYLGTDIQYGEYTTRRLDVASLPEAAFVATAGIWFGTETLNLLPLQNCLLPTWKGVTAYPRASRVYISGFTEAANGGTQTPISALLTAAIAWGLVLVTLTITGGNNAVKMAVNRDTMPVPTGQFNPVTAVTCGDAWYTQRRRRPGVGS